jgi:alpha-1,6-mannosyltransferase
MTPVRGNAESLVHAGARTRLLSPVTVTLLLTMLAVMMELVLLFGWLRPLSFRRFQHNPPDGAPMVTFLGRTREGALEFAVPALLLITGYSAAVWLSGRARGRAAVAVALLAPVLFTGTLLPMFPGGTQDIFHNVADGRLFWRYGENPTLVPPSAHPEDAFFPHLFGYTDLTSAYGPLWYLLDGIPTTLAGDGFVANLVAQKAMMALFLLATMWLVALARSGDVRALFGGAEDGLQAAVLIGWCPLLLWEFAGNGHNDAIMICLAAAAVTAALRGWWLWGLPLLALSALVKITTVLLGPVLVLWMLSRRDVSRRTLLAGAGLAALAIIAAYAPFWAGRDTLRFLDRPGMTFILSPATVLYGFLAERVSTATASFTAYLLTGSAFTALYALTLWRARRGHTAIAPLGHDALFAYLVLASWWFWPWYVSWLVPLAALTRYRDRRVWVYVLFSSAALLTYCYWWEDPPERSRRWFQLYTAITAGVFVLPSLVMAWPVLTATRGGVRAVIDALAGGRTVAPRGGSPHT